MRCEKPPSPKMIGLPSESVLSTRLRTANADALTLTWNDSRLTPCAVAEISTPLLLTDPRCWNWVPALIAPGVSPQPQLGGWVTAISTQVDSLAYYVHV